MNSRRLIVLGLAVLVLAGVAVLLSQQQAPEKRDQGALLLPGLEAALNDIDRLMVTGPGGAVLATLKRSPAGWTVDEAAGYPADLGMIRRNLLALSNARIVEPKTALPEFYDRLGVEDVASDAATGLQLDIVGGDFAASLIIGQTNVSGGNMAYVRLADDAQSYMINAQLDPADSLNGWVDRELVDIGSRDIRRVRIEHPDGEVLVIEKSEPEATDFTVLDIPAGRELTYAGAANSIGAALAGLEFDSVVDAAGERPPAARPVLSRFETFDGLTIEARSFRADEGYRVAFAAAATAPPGTASETAAESADGPAARAASLNSRFNGWLYTLPSYKTDQLIKRMADLLAAPD